MPLQNQICEKRVFINLDMNICLCFEKLSLSADKYTNKNRKIKFISHESIFIKNTHRLMCNKLNYMHLTMNICVSFRKQLAKQKIEEPQEILEEDNELREPGVDAKEQFIDQNMYTDFGRNVCHASRNHQLQRNAYVINDTAIENWRK